MSQKQPTPEAAAPRSEPARNPYIMNFMKVLVEKKGENPAPEALKKLTEDMYRIFEYMLGQNMVNALPVDIRKDYMTMAEDLANLNYDKIGKVFDPNVQDYQKVMKETMREFAEIFLRNRDFKPEDYPVCVDPA